MSTETILLIDGHSLAYRAFYAFPVENFTTSTGQPTNAVYGFVSMLLTAVQNERPTHLAVAFDLGRETFRLEEYPEYKAGRAKTPEEFHGQVELIKEVLAALGVPVFTREGFEADDVLASLAKTAEQAGLDAFIATGDKDSFQLAGPHTTILYPKRGLSDLMRMTPDAVEEKYGVSPENYRGLAALVGEKADNLPGVPGVGEKTAAKWLSEFGNLPEVLAHATEIKGKVGQKLREHIDQVERNYRLNRLVNDLDMGFDLAAAAVGGGDPTRTAELFDQLEFRQFASRVTQIFMDEGAEPGVQNPEIPAVLVEDAQTLALEILHGTTPVGMAVSSAGAVAVANAESIALVELSALGETEFNSVATALQQHENLIVHDAKPALKVLHAHGIDGVAVHTDTELVAYLLVPDARSYLLEDLVRKYLGIELDAASAAGELDLLGAGTISVGQHAWAAGQLAAGLRERLAQAGGIEVLDNIERPTQAILARMEIAGVAVDRKMLSDLRHEFEQAAQASASEAYRAIGHEVNLGSPKQLQGVLFDELGMPKTKKTKTGYTTDADALAELFAKTHHPFLENLLAHRDRTKLKQTVVGLEKVIADDDRIHTTYLQTVAATGRLSSKDPNLQNIPVRTEAGRRIRESFVAGENYDGLLSADYSQIEMRIMAHLSEDAALIAAFQAGEDLHRYVAGQVFGIATEAVTDDQRSQIKAMSYGLVYGLSAYGLSRQLGISAPDARALMEAYFERFGAVKAYLDGVVDDARIRGYTETMYGRRRYLEALGSSNRQIREMAGRAALNAPIQGSAADIMKIAMIRVDQALSTQRLSSRILLQVHDEIILEVAPGERAQVTELVQSEMGAAANLSVPLDVNVGYGPNWHAAAH